MSTLFELQQQPDNSNDTAPARLTTRELWEGEL